MGLSCSCLKNGNQEMDALHDIHAIDRQVVRACEVQRPKRQVYLSSKNEGDNDNGTETSRKGEFKSPKSMYGEMKIVDENRSVSLHGSPHESIAGDQAEEEDLTTSRRGMLGGLGGLNRMRGPLGSLFHNSSPVSTPADGGLSPHSPHTPRATSPPLSPLPSSSRRSTEAIRAFAERISKQILSIGRDREDEMEIAWFCDRGTEKDVWRDENEEKEAEEIMKVVGGGAGECNSGWKGGVVAKKEGQARWRVVLMKRPSEGGSTAQAKYDGDDRSEQVEEEEDTRRGSCETTGATEEGTEEYEELDESEQSDETIVVLSDEDEDVLHISMGIAVKAMKFGGIREDRIVIIVYKCRFTALDLILPV